MQATRAVPRCGPGAFLVCPQWEPRDPRREPSPRSSAKRSKMQSTPARSRRFPSGSEISSASHAALTAKDWFAETTGLLAAGGVRARRTTPLITMTEWGWPVHDDVRLFEKICLEGFQSGLSWLTILRKRENFRKAFADFDYQQSRSIQSAQRGASRPGRRASSGTAGRSNRRSTTPSARSSSRRSTVLSRRSFGNIGRRSRSDRGG